MVASTFLRPAVERILLDAPNILREPSNDPYLKAKIRTDPHVQSRLGYKPWGILHGYYTAALYAVYTAARKEWPNAVVELMFWRKVWVPELESDPFMRALLDNGDDIKIQFTNLNVDDLVIARLIRHARNTVQKTSRVKFKVRSTILLECVDLSLLCFITCERTLS